MRKLPFILAIFLALFLCACPALAERGPTVADEADLLTAEEEAELTRQADQLADEFQVDFTIWLANDLGGQEVKYFAADTYDYNGYGYGAERDGTLFLLSMAERDWYMLTTGSAIQIFTDYGIEKIGEDVVSYLSDGEYFKAFERYLRDARIFLEQAQKGEPFDVDHTVMLRTMAERMGVYTVVSFLIALIAALITVLIMRAGMRTARRKADASDYVRENSFNLTRERDIFLYHTQTRTKIEQSSSSSGGGSSTFTSSSGSSHGGGGGKF